MKKVLFCLLIAVLVLTFVTITVYAAAPDQPVYPGYNYYVHYPIWLQSEQMPKYIKASFDYDRDFIDIVPDYPKIENFPDYNGVGYAFPLASEQYGSMYDVTCSVDDTVITFEYRLKDGFTLNDYLAVIERDYEAGTRYSFPLFDIAMKEKVVVIAKTVDVKVLDAVADDGTVLFKEGEQLGTAALQSHLLPLLNLDPVPVPTEPDYKYIDKLLSWYFINGYNLSEYDEVYEHTDSGGEVDWAIIRAAVKDGRNNPGVDRNLSKPYYFEFGNRVMETNYYDSPFKFKVGFYSVKHDRCFDVTDPAVYELSDIEKVWTQIGDGRLIGDMDDDNSLTIVDATIIQRCQIGLREYPESDINKPIDMVDDPIRYFSDFNQDGERDISDATAIQRFLVDLPYHAQDWIPYPHIERPEPPKENPTVYIPVKPTQPAPTQPETTESAPTESVPTEPVPTEPTEPIIPETEIPEIIGFRSIGKGVEIRLSTVKDAEKYRVYYKNAKGSWVKMGETSTSTFVDTDVNVGSTYRYTVRCINNELTEFTSDYNHTGWTYTYQPELEKPVINGFEAASNGLKIKWGAVDGADLYRIYRSDSGGWVRLADVRETSYIDTDAQNGYNLYTVRCLSCNGKDFASGYNFGRRFYLEYQPDILSLTVRADCMRVVFRRGEYEHSSCRIYRKKDSGGWQRIGVLPYAPQTYDTLNGKVDRYVFCDYDVEPGKTYTYTVRTVTDDDGSFTSWYNTAGWSKKYSVENYCPELDYVLYADNNSLLIHAKENKFGLNRYRADVSDIYNGSQGYITLGSDPAYIRMSDVHEGRGFRISLTGLDENGKRISADDWEGTRVKMISPPENFRAQKTDERKYRFRWNGGGYGDIEYLTLVSEDGQYEIYSDTLTNPLYEADLSDYPEDIQWNVIIVSASEDGISISRPLVTTFSESDY